MTAQLDFMASIESENQAKEIAILKEQLGNLRRGSFMRMDKLLHMIEDLKKEIETLKGGTDRTDKVVEFELLEARR